MRPSTPRSAFTLLAVLPWAVFLMTASCGSDDGSDLMAASGSAGSQSDAATGGASGSGGAAGTGGAAAYAGEAGSATGGIGGDAGNSGAGGADAASLADPAQEGPFSHHALDGKAGTVAVHCEVPEPGPSSGPYPVVLIAHGFQLESSRYYGYAARLGSFGYVACTVDYSNLGGQDKDPIAISAVLDWVVAEGAKPSGPLDGLIDASLIGVMGHSRGGKAAVVAASADNRFKAVLGLDPVNTCPGFGQGCPDGIGALASMSIPTAFLGETTDDGTGGPGQACAPAADNYQKFYGTAPSPSLQVTVNGANHMSFVVDLTNCLACGFCKPATADHQAVVDLSYSFTVAFFERRLRGVIDYDDYLTGTKAQERYVQVGLATIESK